jgi:hypothetical protein
VSHIDRLNADPAAKAALKDFKFHTTAPLYQGISEIIYQPTGPDIPGELEAFYAAARAAAPDQPQAPAKETRSVP